MKLFTKPSGFILIVFLLILACRKTYDPPAIQASNHFLAVDGFINTGTNSITSITVSRSLNLHDSVPNIPELGAHVVIQSSGGNSYMLQDTAGDGVYVSKALTLDTTLNYQLAITGADGNKYISDFVSPKSSPPIDSITWELVDDPITLQQAVKIYVNSHDANNNTHYYRWDYLQTFKHLSVYETPWGQANGRIFSLFQVYGSTYNTHSCWTTSLSGNILLGTSIALSQDVISQALIADIQQNDATMDLGSSFLVRQYPLTAEAYNYWLTVQKNSQSLGGLFDLQPSQITGNLHCTTNPGNPALGYVSASSVHEERIYISNKSLPNWKSNPAYSCVTYGILQDQTDLLIYSYPDTAYGPYHFEGDFIIYLIVAPKSCMDCRYQGGINQKPDFWPQYD
jgi:hypothetical protein